MRGILARPPEGGNMKSAAAAFALILASAPVIAAAQDRPNGVECVRGPCENVLEDKDGEREDPGAGR